MGDREGGQRAQATCWADSERGAQLGSCQVPPTESMLLCHHGSTLSVTHLSISIT